MAFTVSNLITDVSRRISPANPSDSKDLLGAVGDSARRLLSNVAPKDLSRRAEIENALYDQVFRFNCPEDLEAKDIMQWFKLDKDHNTDTFYHPMMQTTNRRFDQHKHNHKNLFTVEWQSGVKFLKVSDFSGNVGSTIHTMDSLTDNGSWNVFGNVVNLTLDNLNYLAGSGSLRFDINTSSNTGGIENFDITPVDISEFFVTGKIFSWLNVPNLNQFQTVTLDLYSSAGNYYSITVNSPHDTSQFQLNWNLLGFPFDTRSMTTVGTPDPKAINHIKVTFVTNGTLLMQNVRMDNIVMRKGAAYGIQYVSEYMFHDVQTGIWKLRPTDGSDIIHVESETYNILLSELACVLGQELFTGTKKEEDLVRLERMRRDDYKMYKQKNKEEFIEENQDMYNFGVRFGYAGGRFGYGSHDGHDHRDST